jgi:hypothetical protein
VEGAAKKIEDTTEFQYPLKTHNPPLGGRILPTLWHHMTDAYVE